MAAVSHGRRRPHTGISLSSVSHHPASGIPSGCDSDMKRFGRWLLRLLRSALLLTLVLALMPWVSELVKNLFPEPLSARTVSEILSHEMRMSRRLETCRVEDDGVLVSTVDAFLIGTAFMTADNPGKACGQMLRKLTNALKKTDEKNVSK